MDKTKSRSKSKLVNWSRNENLKSHEQIAYAISWLEFDKVHMEKFSWSNA